jgi:hypothetical protein
MTPRRVSWAPNTKSNTTKPRAKPRRAKKPKKHIRDIDAMIAKRAKDHVEATLLIESLWLKALRNLPPKYALHRPTNREISKFAVKAIQHGVSLANILKKDIDLMFPPRKPRKQKHPVPSSA